MTWVHIDFWFKIHSAEQEVYLSKEEQKDFEKLLANIIKKLEPIRKFYLWEPVPHCFLALEGVPVWKIAALISKIKKPYIDKICITKKTGDEGNGEGFLNVLNAMTNFYLFSRDNKLSHVIHCCLEFIFQSRHAGGTSVRERSRIWGSI